MTEYPLTHKQVLSLRWRDELNRILNDTGYPTNGERVFLTCFLHDKCNWSELGIIELILKYAKWADLDPRKTTRQVNQICEKKSRYGSLRSATTYAQFQSSKSMDCVGTCTEETQQANIYKKVVETRRCCADVNDVETKNLFAAAFQVSTGNPDFDQETTMSRDLRVKAPPQTVRTIATINDGGRFYRICEKEGSYGGFFSLESGWLTDIEHNGEQLKVPSRSDKYFTLPNSDDTMKGIIAALQQLVQPVEEPITSKKKK
jgi:hypothetical protein